MNCHEVEEHIELFAAGECPPALADEVRRHLASCSSCRQAIEKTRRFLGLLDLRFQGPEQLRRLQARLDTADRRLPIAYRLLATAAALLLAVGLSWWLFPRLPTGQSEPPLVQRPVELTGVVVVWASPGAQWKALTERKIELTAGKLRLRTVHGAAGLAPLEVVTPAAVATAPGAEFIVDVRPPTQEGDPKMRLKTLVTVSVLGGLVCLSNALGTATGERGDRLAAEENAAPTREGVSPDEQRVISRGLDWLALQQKDDGHWEANGGQYASAMTGMAGMALLMEGSSMSEGKYAKEIRKAVQWTLDNTQSNGLVSPRRGNIHEHYIHGHGFGLLFLASAHGEELEERQRKELEAKLALAVDFSCKAQTKAGGWFYTSAADGHNRDEGSTTVTQLQALRTARNAGIPVPPDTITKAQKYLEACTGPNGGIYYSPQVREERPPITAAGIVCGFSIGDYRTPIVKKWITFCRTRVGEYGSSAIGHDEYAQYYWAQAMYALGETGYQELFPEAPKSERLTWSKYRKPSFKYLMDTQKEDHWTGAGRWSQIGPVYVTSVNLAILQLEKGVLPIYQR